MLGDGDDDERKKRPGAGRGKGSLGLEGTGMVGMGGVVWRPDVAIWWAVAMKESA